MNIGAVDLSFVILTWNSAKCIERCLDSVVNSLAASNLSFEILVVDNGSTDETRNILENYTRSTQFLFKPVYLSRNHGTTYPRNLALKQVSGNYIAVMDSDVELVGDCISKLIDRLSQDAMVGLVAPRLVYPTGHLQKSTDGFPTLMSKLKRFLFLRQMERRTPEVNGPVEVDYAISAMWLLRRTLLQKIGYLDENIFYAPEDADYCLSCWRSGYKVLYYPQAVAIHHTQELSRGLKLNRAKIEHLKGLIYFFWKHGYILSAPRFTTSGNVHVQDKNLIPQICAELPEK